MELRPRRVEAELKIWFEKWLRRAHRTHNYQLDDMAKEAIRHIASRAFIAGKVKASRELRAPWQISGNDTQVIQTIAQRYEADFEKVMQQTRIQLIVKGSTDWQQVFQRLGVVAQMLTWTAYNQGKASEFRRSTNQNPPFMASIYKYDGQFMFQTAADDLVCDECAPYSGTMADTYDDLVAETDEPPLHINCRCELVATPTVPTVDQQQRFREAFIADEGGSRIPLVETVAAV